MGPPHLLASTVEDPRERGTRERAGTSDSFSIDSSVDEVDFAILVSS
jgi:hypothetical protein